MSSSQPEICADSQTAKVLELPQLLARVASLAQTAPGAELVRALRPVSDHPTVARRQRRLSQLRALLAETGAPSLENLAEAAAFFPRLAVDGAFLLPEELLVVAGFLAAVGRAAAFLDLAGEEMDELFRLRNRITPLPEHVRRIRQVVGPGNSVASSASAELAGVRRDLQKNRERLRDTLGALVGRSDLAGVFSDQLVTQRAERFVVPVRTDAKGKVKGIIHATSGSGATCFVEPLEAVEDNNRLALLRQQEREEEERVLREVAAELSRDLAVLAENLEALAKLDCLLAQASFCARLDAVEPVLAADGPLELDRARHPLLAWRALAGRGQVTPIDVAFPPDARILVISGANAGGKTATIKTVGLLCLMALCGLHIPAREGSRLPLFGQVFCEVGDEQDLDKELSTFTAHAGRLAWILSRAGRDSLVLIDELGAGTDPGEGSALGIALLEGLMRAGSRVMLTTHFHRLKAFASLTPGAENVSVAFDSLSGRPTYQLHYGAPGFSDALAVSRGLGFPPELLARAEELLDQGERETVALLQKAREDRDRATAERDAARKERGEAQREREEAKTLLKRAREERAGALAEGKRRVREVARRMEERLAALLKEAEERKTQGEALKAGGLRQEVYAARRQGLEEVDQALVDPAPPSAAGPVDLFCLKTGDPVRVANLGQTGRLLEDLRPGLESVAVSVGVRGVRVVVPVRELEPVSQAPSPAPAPAGGVVVLASADDGLDLKLVGMTVDEALPLVDKALDQAILAGRPRLRVVHGVGSGRLRQAVRDYLKNHPFVAATGQEPSRRGGAGVTVVELRD